MACTSNGTSINSKSISLLQNNLELLQNLLQQIIDSSDKRVLVFSNNKIVHANPSALADLGYSHKTIIKTKPDSILLSTQGGGVSSFFGVGVSLKNKNVELDPIKIKRFDNKVVMYKPTVHRCLWNCKSSVLVVLNNLKTESITEQLPDYSNSQQHALSSTSVFFWDFNLKTSDLYIDPQYFELLGVKVTSTDSVIDKWLTPQNTDSQKKFEQVISSIKTKKNTHYQWQYRVTDREEKLHNMLATLDVVEWDNLGNPLRLAGVHIEIENGNASKLLSQSSDTSLKRFVKNSLDGIIILDNEGKIVEWNPEQEKITNVKRDDAVGKHIWMLQQSLLAEQKPVSELIEELNDLFEGIQRNATNSWVGKMFESKIKGESNHTKILQHSAFPIDSEQGQLVVITNRDITESKHGLIRLEKSEERLKLALTASRVGIWDVDHITGERYYSPMMYAILGYRPLEVEPSEVIWAKHIHPEDVDYVNQKNKMLSISGTNLELEFRIIRKDGEIIWVQSKTRVIRDERNKTIRTTGTVNDITKQKSIEMELRKHQEVLTRNIEQHKVVANISFTLNTNKPIDEKIEIVLSELGKFTQSSRVYIFQDVKDKRITANTYEWCNQGISSQKEKLQDVPLEMVEQWMGTDKYKISRNLSQEKPRELALKLIEQDIESIIIFRLYLGGQEFGFIGFDECGYRRIWTQPEVDLLSTISNLISFAFEREVMWKKGYN